MRDIDCYIRAYTGGRRFDTHSLKEESFECPFQELNLIHPLKNSDLYRFAIGPKSSLPPEIIGFAIYEYLNQEKKPGGHAYSGSPIPRIQPWTGVHAG